jgi:hypothetical protein
MQFVTVREESSPQYSPPPASNAELPEIVQPVSVAEEPPEQ